MDDNMLINLAKELKLDGMSGTLTSRLQEARNKSLAYEEFLGLILQDEKQVRQFKNLANRIKQAKFEEIKTLEGLDLKKYSSEVKQSINHLMTGQYLKEKKNVIILGPTGTGKTHLAQGLAHHACRNGYKVKFAKANTIISDLQSSRADDSWKRMLLRYSKTDLLVMDDFGLKALTQGQACDLYELIESKYINSNFIITSNRKTESWYQLFPDPVMANAALDRIIYNSYCIVLEGESYRKNFMPTIQKTEELKK